MSRKRLALFVGIIILLGGASLWLNWRRITGGADPAPDPEILRIETCRQAGNVPAIAAVARDARPDIAIVAAEALGAIGPKAIPAIEEIVEDGNRNVHVRSAAAFSMGKAVVKDLLEKDTPPGGDDRTALLARLAREDPSPDVRAAAVEVLGHLAAYKEAETILQLFDDKNPKVRRGAYWAFRRLVREDPYPYRPDMPESRRAAAIARVRWHWYSNSPQSFAWGRGMPIMWSMPVWKKEVGRFLPK